MRTSLVRLCAQISTLGEQHSEVSASSIGSLPASASSMKFPADGLDKLRERTIGCGIAVHRTLGPGLLESIYRDCMVIELRANGFSVDRERRVSLKYRDQPVGGVLRIDIVVEATLIIEVEAVEKLHPVHSAQLMTYLKLTSLPSGLLMNFNTPALHLGVKRLVHPDLYISQARDSLTPPLL